MHKVAVGRDLEEFIKEVKKVRSPFKSLQYINPFIARAQLGYNIVERLKNLIDPRRLDKKIEKLVTTRWGRAYISKNIIELVKHYGTEKVDLINIDMGEKIGEGVSKARFSLIRNELKELNRMNLDGKEYMKRLKEILDKNLGEEASAKIMRRLMVLIHNADVGKRGIINPGRAVYQEGGKIRIVDYDVKDSFKIRELAEKAGVRRTKIDYFKHKDALLMAEAIERSSSVQEAVDYYIRRFNEELERDALFRQGFQEWLHKELIRIYNFGAAFTALQELLVKLPLQLSATINRMLASAVRRLPVAGDIAAVHYEAGAVLAEIGDKLSDRVEAAASMWFTLSGNLAGSDVVKQTITRSIEETQKAEQMQTK